MPKQNVTVMRMAARRRKVAGLLLDRRSQQEIAMQLEVSQATISADIQAIRAGWIEEARADLQELVAQECRILDADEAVWRGRLQDALKNDLPVAIRIYARVISPILERRARLRGMLPLPKDGHADFAALDEALRQMGLGPDSAGAVPAWTE